MEITQLHTLNLTGVLSESKRIIISRYLHFVTLSLFFLPLSFSLITSPTLRLRFSDQLFTYHPSEQQEVLVYYLLYSLLIYVLSLCAIGTITYSAHHAFFGEPVNFVSALKSLTFSFFPLVSTAIVAHVLIAFISVCFLTFVATILMLLQNLGLVIDYNSIYFLWFSAIAGVILFAIVIYFHVEWSLAFAVVVVESKWGFWPLIRSSYLVKGMRSISLFVMLYLGVCSTVSFVWICSLYPQSVLVTFLGVLFLMMCLVRFTAANTVLYNYCKALHGELAIEVADGFVHDYSNLPSNDEKVPHVVAVAVAG